MNNRGSPEVIGGMYFSSVCGVEEGKEDGIKALKSAQQ